MSTTFLPHQPPPRWGLATGTRRGRRALRRRRGRCDRNGCTAAPHFAPSLPCHAGRAMGCSKQASHSEMNVQRTMSTMIHGGRWCSRFPGPSFAMSSGGAPRTSEQKGKKNSSKSTSEKKREEKERERDWVRGSAVRSYAFPEIRGRAPFRNDVRPAGRREQGSRGITLTL